MSDTACIALSFSCHNLASVTGLVPTHRITNGLIQIPRMITQLFCGFVMGKLVIALQGIQRISGIQRANMPALCIKLNHRRSSTCHPHRQHRQLSGQTFSVYGLAYHIQQILDFIMTIGQNIALASSSFFCRQKASDCHVTHIDKIIPALDTCRQMSLQIIGDQLYQIVSCLTIWSQNTGRVYNDSIQLRQRQAPLVLPPLWFLHNRQ